MKMSNEKVARSVALEQAYVHDVYEQFCESSRSRPWPRVQEFIASLEPGSIICDVGCGNGKYLDISANVFNIGGEKCRRLCEVAREKNNEMLVLDNLALPYRDDSMDAVLSIAVIHHLATTERRVCALRELARVLRIGGRLIISVWAMEQSHRKFESQDVLVPWHRPEHLSTPSLDLMSTTLEEDCIHYHTCTHSSNSDSCKSSKNRKRGKTRRLGTSIDQNPPSSNNSSLSSPNETCYSFVRRAIQKLAGSRRIGGAHRTWFMDGWSQKDPLPKRYDPDGCECCECDAQDLPIELRRVDDDELPQRRQTFPMPQIGDVKSRSLNNVNEMEDNIVRSNSSTTSIPEMDSKSSSNRVLHKPKLVKQKKSICEDDLADADEDLDKPTEIQKLLPDIRIEEKARYRGSVQKQRSLNEELMSTDRLQEKEQLRKKIHKQASLNEELIYHHRNYSFENFRDTYLYTSTAKRLQLIKAGFASKIKATNIERVTGASLRNGFVRMFQQWKSSEVISPTIPEDDIANTCSKQKSVDPGSERRSSKEDGSDSSKDNSLQSDTSVDSEDSFASVIFVPKSNPMSPTISPGPTNSVPNSPRIKQSSCPTSPRIKQMPLSIYPLTKQLSSPKPSTGSILSPTDLKLSELRTSPKPVEDDCVSQKYAVQPIPKFKPNTHHAPETDENLDVIKQMLSAKPGFGTRNSKQHSYPIVRHHKCINNGKVESIAKPLPKLLSLELFNPETDDKDSDSSAVSSPDSVDSVISVSNVDNANEVKFQFPDVRHQERSALLQAARDVAESLDVAVEKVIKSSPRSKRREIKTDQVRSVMQRRYAECDARIPLLGEDDWNVECHRHLTDFADKLSEKLLHEIDQYQEKLRESEVGGRSHSLEHIDDPYIHRLSEELQDLSKLSAEIQKQNEYLAKLSANDKLYNCPKCRKNDCMCRSSKRTQGRRVVGGMNMKVPAIDVNKPTDEAEVNPHLMGGSLNKLNRNGASIDSCDSERGSSPNSTMSTGAGLQLSRHSFESEDTVSRYSGDGGSTASLASCPEWKTIKSKLNIEAQQRASFEERSSHSKVSSKENSTKSHLNPSLSDTSQESLPSDCAGGEITYHRYYHVFREGELDQLIEKYVENLHIISSYYDHTSWCVVAEKVQVWTI